MKALVMFFLGLLLVVPLSALAVEKGVDKAPPPIEQNLVREGDFAVRLADTLGLLKTDNEADAERALATAGISPKNGWISDFPVTPVVLAEIRTSVQDAADGERVKIDKKTAEEKFAALSKDLELPIASDTGTADRAKRYVTGEEYGTPAEYQQDQADINDYYYDEGPPVITYYEPPPDYSYLYAWDPYPFWWGGYWFPGYYVLNDFTIIVGDDHDGHHHHHHHDGGHDRGNRDRVSRDGGHNRGDRDRVSDSSVRDTKLISNRVVDRNTRTVETIDPVTRNTRTASDTTRSGRSFDTTRFSNADTRRGAENILRNTAAREGSTSMTTSGRMGRDSSGVNSNIGNRSFNTAPSARGRSVDMGRSFNTNRSFDTTPSNRGRSIDSGRSYNTNRSFDPAPSLRGRSPVTGRSAAGWSRSVAPASRSMSSGSGSRGFSSPRSFSPAPSRGSGGFGGGHIGGGGRGGGGGGCRGGRC